MTVIVMELFSFTSCVISPCVYRNYKNGDNPEDIDDVGDYGAYHKVGYSLNPREDRVLQEQQDYHGVNDETFNS